MIVRHLSQEHGLFPLPLRVRGPRRGRERGHRAMHSEREANILLQSQCARPLTLAHFVRISLSPKGRGRSYRFTYLLFIVSLFSLIAYAAPAQAQTTYIRAGKLVDVRAGKVLLNQRIEIKADRIVAVTPWRAPSKGAKIVDWSRLTVLPGLIDLHTHLADVSQSSDVAEPLKTSPAATDCLIRRCPPWPSASRRATSRPTTARSRRSTASR